MFGLMVRFEIREGYEHEFDRLTEQTIVGIHNKEPMTILYVCHQVEGAPSARIFYELYRDREAFEEHEHQEHVRAFLEEREQYVADTQVEYLFPWLAKGVTLTDNA